MDDIIYGFLLLIFLAILVIIPNVKIVKDDIALIVERFGKYHKTIINKGVYLLVPLFDRVIETVNLSVLEKVVHINHTQSNKEDSSEVRIKYQIIEPKKFCYIDLDATKKYLNEMIKLLENELDISVINLIHYQNISSQYGIKVIEISSL